MILFLKANKTEDRSRCKSNINKSDVKEENSKDKERFVPASGINQGKMHDDSGLCSSTFYSTKQEESVISKKKPSFIKVRIKILPMD